MGLSVHFTMMVKIGGIIESLTANIATVLLVTRVGIDMLATVTLLKEGLVANRTLVLFSAFAVVVMRLRVPPQITVITENFVAKFALKFLIILAVGPCAFSRFDSLFDRWYIISYFSFYNHSGII